MDLWKKNLALVWLAQFMALGGFWFAMPFVPYYIQELGATDETTRNFWIAAFAISGHVSVAVFSPVWGGFADRFGRKAMLVRANLCNALILPMMGFAPDVFTLVLLRVAMGIFSGSTTASQALIAGSSPMEKRGFAIGTLSSAIYCGTMVGCFLGGAFADLLGYRMAFVLCGLMYMLAGIIIIFGVKEVFQRPVRRTTPLPHGRKRKWQLLGMDLRPLRLAWLILLLITVMDLARKFDISFLPLLVQDIHGSMDGAATWTGIIFGVVACAGIIAGPVLGIVADRLSAPKVALASAIVAGIFMTLQGLAFSMSSLIFFRFITVFAAGGLDPVFQVWLAKTTPDKIRGVVFGWALTAKCIGWVIATTLCGTVATYAGLRWIYPAGGTIYLLLIPMILYTSWRLTRKKPR